MEKVGGNNIIVSGRTQTKKLQLASQLSAPGGGPDAVEGGDRPRVP